MSDGVLIGFFLVGWGCILLGGVWLIQYLLNTRNKSWVNEIRTTDAGITYRYIYKAPTRQSSGKFQLHVETHIPFDFMLEHEDGVHRFTEKWGFTKKFRTHDTAFDNRVYVASDDTVFCEALQNTPALRTAVLSAFPSAVKSIATGHKKLVAKLDPTEAGMNNKKLEKIADSLDSIAKQLTQSVTLSQERLTHPNIWRARLFNIASIALLIAGIWTFMMHPYDIVDQLGLVVRSAALALLVTALYLWLIRTVFHNSARGYNVLKNFVLFGVAGIALGSYAFLYTKNIDLDQSPASVYKQVIREKYTTRGRSSTSYYISVDDWHMPGKLYSIYITQEAYDSIHPGDTLVITTHPGHFNCEWMENAQLVPK